MRSIYSYGFFEAVHERVLEINFEPNPFPKLCVIRSVIMAARLGFRIGPRLAMYISENSAGTPIADFIALQVSHYGSIRCKADVLQEWLAEITLHVHESPGEAFSLPVARAQQLQLWNYWSPTC